jgi:hypothetical protein
VAPPVRKPLSADALLHVVRSGFARPPEHRLDETAIAFTDALLAAFAMCSLTAPALLAFAKERAAGNGPTIYGIARVPGDTARRAILAPVSPQGLRPVCKSVVRPWQRGQALAPLVGLDGHY